MRRYLLLLPIVFLASQGRAKVFESQVQALERAFPGVTPERRTLYLSDAEVQAIQQQAGAKMDNHVVPYYVSRSSEGATVAVFDTENVRTMPVTFMVLLTKAGTIDRVEVLAFHEPDDYLPRDAWLKLYKGRVLDDRLRVRRDIPNVTGASLTSRAMNDGIRKVLALYETAIRKDLQPR